MRKKNRFILSLVDGIVAMIDCELKIVDMEFEHPERFERPDEDHVPLAKWKGKLSELLELFTAVWLDGKLLKPNGEPMAFSDVIALLRRVFGLRISRPYLRKKGLFDRVKDSAPFLKRLLSIFLKHADDANK